MVRSRQREKKEGKERSCNWNEESRREAEEEEEGGGRRRRRRRQMRMQRRRRRMRRRRKMKSWRVKRSQQKSPGVSFGLCGSALPESHNCLFFSVSLPDSSVAHAY